MPPIEQEDRLQDALLWLADGVNEYGETLLGSPEPVKVRWVNKRRQATNPTGGTATVDATVVLDREVPVGSNMYEGTFEDYYELGTSGDRAGIMEVVTMDVTPDINNREFRYEAGLAFYRERPANASS